jgi:hypothetical protein
LAEAEASGKLTSSQKGSLHIFNAFYRIRLKHQEKALNDTERTSAREVMYDVLEITEHLLNRLGLMPTAARVGSTGGTHSDTGEHDNISDARRCKRLRGLRLYLHGATQPSSNFYNRVRLPIVKR